VLTIRDQRRLALDAARTSTIYAGIYWGHGPYYRYRQEHRQRPNMDRHRLNYHSDAAFRSQAAEARLLLVPRGPLTPSTPASGVGEAQLNRRSGVTLAAEHGSDGGSPPACASVGRRCGRGSAHEAYGRAAAPR
jgi:hypothetical protein